MHGVAGRKRKELLVTLRKGEAAAGLKRSLDRIHWGARFGKDCGFVVRQTTH